MDDKLNKKAQEEMVGFVLIIILVAVILLAFLAFSLNKPQKDTIESYEVENFIQAFLQYNSDCGNDLEYYSMQDLIFECDLKNKCSDEKDSCDVLNTTLKELVNVSWPVGENRPYKGYELKIEKNGQEFLVITNGEITKNYKSGTQEFEKKGDFLITFKAYS